MPAGRPKGSTNKRTTEFRERLIEVQKKYKFDLIDLLAKQAIGTDETMFRDMDQAQIAPHMASGRKSLLEYAYPKLKSMEVQNVEPVRIVLIDEEKGTEKEIS